MKRLIIIISTIFFMSIAKSQEIGFGKVGARDSLALVAVLKQFVATIENKDTTNFNEISTAVIKLTNYYGSDSAFKYDFVRDSVRNILFTNLFTSSLINSIKNNRFTLSYSSSRDYSTYKLKPLKGKWFKIYELTFKDYNNDRSDNTFGLICEFNFIKLREKYYFNELLITKY